VLVTKYCSDDKIETNELGVACSACWREEGNTAFWWEILGGRDHLEDPGVDGRITLRLIFRKWDVGGVWNGSTWLLIGTGGGLL
jgi:hypothetical protein